MSENVLGKNDNMCPGCGNTYGDDNLCMPSACQWEGVDRPATPSSGVTEGEAESGEQALKSANEAYRELRAAVHSQLDASGIYMDGDAEDVITEALIEHAEADRKVSCPRCAQWSWHGPDAERKVIEHWERAHAQPPAPEPPDAATVLAGLREEMTAVCADVVEAMQFGLSGIDPYCGRPDDEERWMKRLAEWADWIHGEYVKPIEAAQQRLADRGQSGGSDG